MSSISMSNVPNILVGYAYRATFVKGHEAKLKPIFFQIFLIMLFLALSVWDGGISNI